MPRIPVALCTTIPLLSHAETIPRLNFQGYLYLVNLTCREFLGSNHILVFEEGYIYNSPTSGNVNRAFLCQDGWVEYRGSRHFNAQKVTHPDILTYFTYAEEDAAAAFATMRKTPIPSVFMVGADCSTGQQSVFPVTATLEDFASGKVPLADAQTLAEFAAPYSTTLLTRDGHFVHNLSSNYSKPNFQPLVPPFNAEAVNTFQAEYA